MERQQFFAMLIAIAGITACASERVIGGDRVVASPPYLPVVLSIHGDNQGKLPEFPLNTDPSHYRAYIQATRNDRYRLRVVNNSNQRVGLVIAVDGRNIISGKQSWLANNERMYILNPHDSADYEGWRTNSNQTNRFYFTESQNSYATAWGDNSAIGVIAMAVYAERPRPQISSKDEEMATGSAAEAKTRSVTPSAGTGFGESTYSPSISVSFEPSPEPMEKLFLKYEWRETLCSKGILPDCYRDNGNNNNRLWKEDGFVPPPPR